MQPTLVLNVVGLTPALLGRGRTPHLSRLAARGTLRPITALTPAVTCSMQATFLTGLTPAGHGIVGNGWYYRDTAEVRLWQQSHHLMHGERIWQAARRREPGFTCAQLFWWFNMYAEVEWSVTPRPIYAADGRKLPDCYSEPPELRDRLTGRLGPFPLFRFWGPKADIVASRWIAECALDVLAAHRPGLTLVYLPHLDYNLQRLGPDHPAIDHDLAAVDALCGELIDFAAAQGFRIAVLSEYGITAVNRPVHINRALRAAGLLRWRVERGREQLDAGASRAFAVADHQVAHVYVRDPSDLARVEALLTALPGVEQVLAGEAKRAAGLDHPRAGELVAVAAADAWFTWYHWLDDARAPDFARTVDIHRKPGYDPVELFLDPAIRFPRLALARRLLASRLGFRTLMDLIPLDATLVKGSHGRPTDRAEEGPLLILSEPDALPPGAVAATSVKGALLDFMSQT